MNTNTKAFLGILFLVIVTVAALASSAFIVQEGQQAVVTRFGKPAENPITEPGLYFKSPFIEDVRYLDKRILWWDGDSNQLQTKQKVPIKVDTTARWKITDPILFIEKVQNEAVAKSRIDTALDSIVRNVIAEYNLVEAVRTSNDILNRLQELQNAPAEEGLEEISGTIETVKFGREKLSELIAERAKDGLREWGITLVDVQLRQISYEESTERKVFERMKSERQRIANKYRSVGQGEAEKIRGKLSQDLQQIESQAYREVQTIVGEAEAQAIEIYANAYNQEPEFYDFVRTLEAYDKAIHEETHFILSTESEFLKVFKQGENAYKQ